MIAKQHKRGGATVGVLSHMDPWQAELIVNLRLWCEGCEGQQMVWNCFAKSLPGTKAVAEIQTFETLISLLNSTCHRPLVRHQRTCACVGADEAAFAHLVSTASQGDLGEATLIATLLVRAAHAEHAAVLAAHVGCAARAIATAKHLPGTPSQNVRRLH